MGLTIHFKGQLSSAAAYEKLLAAARSFAYEQHCSITTVEEESKHLSRVTDDEKDWNYTGPVTGVRIDLKPDCEPLVLEFDTDFYIQEYVKTQFAGADTHALIVGFLRRVEPLFMHLGVFDETEFWETDDLQLLRENLARCQSAIEEMAAQHPGCQYKVHTPYGRIIDLIT